MSALKIGDRAIVAFRTTCCGSGANLGKVGVVVDILPFVPCACITHGYIGLKDLAMLDCGGDGEGLVHLGRLVRLPPDNEMGRDRKTITRSKPKTRELEKEKW